MQTKKLILASGSPRRQDLLRKMGYDFDIIVPDVDENVEGEARDIVSVLSFRKASAAAKQVSEGIIIASDTLVSIDSRPLGKPNDEQDAFAMLSMLSGRTHEVFTGVTVMDAESGKTISETVRTGVRFRKLTDSEILEYISTGEPMDKAGAYAIQGGAAGFVEELNGSLENVIGFPVDTVEIMLHRFM